MSKVRPAGMPLARITDLKLVYRGYAVTALSLELAAIGHARRYQTGFTVEGHTGDASPRIATASLVFDSPANALKAARADAKRFIDALIARAAAAAAKPAG